MDTEPQGEQRAINWLEVWASALKPSAARLRRIAEHPRASLLWGLAWSGVSTVLMWLSNPYSEVVRGAFIDQLGPQVEPLLVGMGGVIAVLVGWLTLLTTAGIFHGTASWIGGQGQYRRLVFMWGALPLPFTVLTWLVGFIPSLFPLHSDIASKQMIVIAQLISLGLMFVVALYSSIAQFNAYRAVYRLSIGSGLGGMFITGVIIGVGIIFLSAVIRAVLTPLLTRGGWRIY